jgi:hypothetical protein
MVANIGAMNDRFMSPSSSWRVAQRSTKTDDPFDFLVPQRQVRSDTIGVPKLSIAAHLMVSRGTRVRFGGLDERSPDASPLQGGLHVPALDEWHW